MRRSARSSPSSSSRARNASMRLSESIKKSAGRTSPAHKRNLAAPGTLSSERATQVGDHAAVAAAGAAVREEAVAIVGAAPRSDRHLVQTELPGLLRQDGAQVEGARTCLGSSGEAGEDLRPDFVAAPANPNPAMHYDVRRARERLAFEQLHSALQNTVRHTAPPRVHQGHRPLRWHREIDGNAIRHRDGEQHAARPCGVAVHAVQDEPAVSAGLVPRDARSMDLMAEDDGGEAGLEGGAEGAPAGHHLPHVFLAPQAEAEPVAAGRDTGDGTVARRPLTELE